MRRDTPQFRSLDALSRPKGINLLHDELVLVMRWAPRLQLITISVAPKLRAVFARNFDLAYDPNPINLFAQDGPKDGNTGTYARDGYLED